MKYEKYKDSGVEWLGEIPSHWEVLTVKRFGKTKAGGTPSTTNLKFWDGNIPWLPSGKLQNCEINTAEKFITVSGLKNSATKLIKPNTTMIALTGATCANIGYLKFEACANQSVIAIEEYENVNSKFLYYALINERNQILLSQTGGAQAGINETDVKNIILPTPTYTEQTAIADFLDRKTALIDQAIDIKQKQIELLKERRQILIHKAVTRGVTSSEVEMPNVKLKDSGVEWIGEIPEGWEVKRIKHLGKIINGFAFNSGKFKDAGVRVMKISNIQTMRIDWSDESFVDEKYFRLYPQFRIIRDDLVFALTRPVISTGIKATIVDSDERILLNQRNAVLKPSKNLNKKWIYFIILNSQFVQSFDNQIDKTGQQPNISTYNIGNLEIPFPSLGEQIKISEYLEIESSKIATAISLKEQEIEKLKEYKATLINSAVTGKIKVYNHAK